MNTTYPNHTKLHDSTRYAIKILTEDIWISKNVNGVGIKVEKGEKVYVRVREFDWGVAYTAFLIRHRECLSTTKSVGITPKEYVYNVNSEILEDLYAKKFCL